MKYILVIIATLFLSTSTFSTEWAWFYVYTENDYTQGPWTRTSVLDKSGSYRYLHPTLCEELLGSGREDLALAILKHLKKADPKKYAFKYDLTVLADTVVMTINGKMENDHVIKNELIASFTLNNFKALRIKKDGQNNLYTLKDLSIPYLDLRLPNEGFENGSSETKPAKTAKDTVIIRETIRQDSPDEEAPYRGPQSVWITASLALNGLLVFLLIRRKKPRK